MTLFFQRHTDPENVFIIASQKLYKDSKTFSFNLPKKDIEGQVIQVRYAKTNADDVREKFEDADQYVDLGTMNVVLDANGTFDAALIKEEIRTLATSSPEIIKDLVRNFDSTLEKEILANGKGTTDDFKSYYMQEKAVELILQVKNKEIDEKEFITSLEALKSEAKTALIKGGRLECGSAVSVVQSAEFSGTLVFTATDKQTVDAFGSKKELGYIYSAAEGIDVIGKVNADFQKIVNAKGFIAIFYYLLKDDKNGIVSQCKVAVSPKAPEATFALFEKFDVKNYGKVEESLADLSKMYEGTFSQLKKDYETAKISFDSEQFKAQVIIIDGWYNDRVDQSVAHFLKK